MKSGLNGSKRNWNIINFQLKYAGNFLTWSFQNVLVMYSKTQPI